MKQEEYKDATTVQRQEATSSSSIHTLAAREQQKHPSFAGRVWKQVSLRLQSSTFSPQILRGPLAHPAAGYLIAFLSQSCAIALVVWLVQFWPQIHFREALPLLVILLVALGWGTGPSIAATLTGTLIILLLRFPHPFLFTTISIEDSIGVSIFLGVGLVISGLTSQVQRARQRAERLSSNLTAVLDAIPDSVTIYDAQGRLVQTNRSARECMPTEQYASLSDIKNLSIRTLQGEPLASHELPLARALRGEIISDFEFIYPEEEGQRERYIAMSAAPWRSACGTLQGVVTVARDFSALKGAERAAAERTRQALQALLAMARLVVLHPSHKDDAEPEERLETLQRTVQQLADLVQPVLSNQRMSISLIDPQTGRNTPLAATGLTEEYMQQWWSELNSSTVQEYLPPALLNRLRAGEFLVLDLVEQPPMTRGYYGFGLTLAVPLLSNNQLIGIFAIDNGQREHTYTEDEITVAHAVAQLATLVIERERLEVEHTNARASVLALQETNRLMNEFLSVAAHEIRTPLTTIKASLQLSQRQLKRLLDDESSFPAQVRSRMMTMYDLLERAERQASRQTRLVRDLLDVSRIQANRFSLHTTRFNLATLVGDVISDQRTQTPQRIIHLESCEEELPVLADRDRIEQALDNYLSNALKYSEADKPVLVRLEHQESGYVRVQVHDEGPGLSLEEQQRIWERFYRAPDIEVRSGSGIGLGLGLHISRTIIELHAGEVGLESTPGQGSTFWFTLPLADN